MTATKTLALLVHIFFKCGMLEHRSRIFVRVMFPKFILLAIDFLIIYSLCFLEFLSVCK